MVLITTSSELKNSLERLQGMNSVGFVPTMGALHPGHLSLVERAVSENDIAVVSIFVNPTQFNSQTDLERYPRDLKRDMKMLEKTGCDIVFAPAVADIYPEPDNRIFDFDGLDTVMEGKFRPGHFNGVAQVVSRLFEIVEPGKAYFGLKDFQQLAIIRRMVNKLQLPVEIVPCELVREKSGLAMSSRNELLSPEERQNAAVIYETLTAGKKLKGEIPVSELVSQIKNTINKNPFMDVEYVEIIDENTLRPIENWNYHGSVVVCVAAWCGRVRLIDNMVFN